MPNRLNPQTYQLSNHLESAVSAALAGWSRGDKTRRLWSRDASLWTGGDEAAWLGWLDIVERQLLDTRRFSSLAAEVRAGGFTHALVLGMGGSSLAPEVLSETFGQINGFPRLLVLDSTDPAQVAAFGRRIDPARTIFMVSSKSGTTLEPNVFKQHFFDVVRRAVGERESGSRFIAITDPGSRMQRVAEADGFRHIFFGLPTIGGRYSALSDFGMIPAAIMGVDVPSFLAEAREMVAACTIEAPVGDNPGVVLGAILGAAAGQGRNKITLIASPAVQDFGAWLEQLIAESTGKNGAALIPVDRERPGGVRPYGVDRVFVYLRLQTAPEAAQDEAVEALEKAGHPVVRILIRDAATLGQEFFRWEFATAVAGSIMGIHPFDQPDVEASKIETRKLTDEYEKTGSLPTGAPFSQEANLKLYADPANIEALGRTTRRSPAPREVLKAHLLQFKPGDYFALLAYIEMNPANEAVLQEIRHAVRDAKGVATCLGFGPRFLHSTGQAYKGGPNTGVFLQVTCDDAADLPIPEQKYSFGIVKAAQAQGDFEVLAQRGRRVLRVHLGADVPDGLTQLKTLIENALS